MQGVVLKVGGSRCLRLEAKNKETGTIRPSLISTPSSLLFRIKRVKLGLRIFYKR